MKRASLLLCTVLVACSGRSAPPEPDWQRGVAPELRGARVLVLPVQSASRDRGEVDRELYFALSERGDGVEWVDVDALDGIRDGGGPSTVAPHNLSLGAFRVGQVRQIGDPLFGEVYRLAALVDARFVLLPIAANELESNDGRRRAVLDVTLVEPRTGRVLWQVLLQGDPGEAGSPALLVSAAERVAARLLP
jgi:hypothetical protein